MLQEYLQTRKKVDENNFSIFLSLLFEETLHIIPKFNLAGYDFPVQSVFLLIDPAAFRFGINCRGDGTHVLRRVLKRDIISQ